MHLNSHSANKANTDFRRVFNEHFSSMQILANRIMQNEDKARDITQEVFIKLWEKDLTAFDNESALRAYLYVMIKNKCISQIRREKGKEAGGIDDEYLMLEEKNVIDEILREETYHLLHEAIKTLPRQAEKVIILALNGYKNEEIAHELGVSVNTIKTQKKRAYHALREKLGNQFVAIILCQFIDFF